MGALVSSAQAQSFTDVTATWGAGFTGAGTGSAWADYDADGDLDLYAVFSSGETNILYTNTGSAFTISGEAEQTGSNDNGATWGDYDGDGDLDLFATDAGGNDFLWQNDGAGSFSDAAATAGVQTGGDYSPGWVDYDRDGDLDLYVAVYGGANLLFHNDGSGSFVDVAAVAGIDDSGNSEGTSWGDYNNDGWPDLYIADNSAANVIYENDGDGTFTDVTSTATIGAGVNAIGGAWGDYNNDGWLDLHVVFNSVTPDALYKNNGDGTFTNDAVGASVANATAAVSSVWADFDLDGDLDLYVNVSGAANLLYSNNGNGTFTDVAGTAGVDDAGTGRGSTWADIDDDGDVDLFVVNNASTNKLFENTSTAGKSWVKLDLTGDGNNTSAIGAVAVAWTGGSSQRQQVEGISSWNSQNSPERIFGFGSATTIDSVIVRWPSGQVSASFTPAVSATLSLTEPVLTVFSSVATAAGVNDSGNHWRGGVWADYDNDGDEDLYLFTDNSTANKLYKNNGNSTFTNLGGTTANSGDNGGAVWGDYDADGDLDLYVTTNGAANLLYRYDGSDTFVDDATNSGTGSTGASSTAAWMDYDNDGDLDLFVSASAEANLLYNNSGTGIFTDVATTALVTDASGQARGVAWGDYDGDGDQDLYIANQSAANKLYSNNGNGTFADVGGTTADASNSLSPVWVDFDNDNDLDLFVYNGATDNRLYRNDGGGTFVDVAVAARIAPTATGGQGVWADYDNDGDLDLYVATSAPNSLFLNNGNGAFDEVGHAAGVAGVGSGLGASWGDYDGNGFLDLFVANLSGTQNLLFDNQTNTNKWLHVELEGLGSDSYGYGATIWATEAAAVQRRDIDGGSGYLAHDSPTAEFGFGNLGSTVDEIKVIWSSGFSNVLTSVATDQAILVTERAVVSQTPHAGDVNASVSADVTAAFSAAVTPLNVNTFVVHGSQTGERSGSYSGSSTDNISFNPTNDFKPGEEVEVRFADGTSAGLLSYRGTPVKSYVYRYTVAAGTGPAEFTSVFSAPFSSSTHGVDLGDVDGDGDLDLVAANSAKQNAVYLNDATGAMVGGPNNFGTGSDNTMSIDMGDLDGDGDLDLVAGNISEQNTSHLNDGSGGFAASANFGTSSDATRPVVLGDLDGDGYMDVAVGNDGAQNVVYFNDGAGVLDNGSENFGTSSDATKGLEIGDVDKDGDLDLFIGNYNEANKIALNDGWGAFEVGNTFGTGSDPTHWLAVGDIDGDGDVDVVSANIGSQSRPETNDGAGTFAAGTAFGASATARGLKLGDVDGDGDLDAALSYDSGTVSSVYLNNASGVFSAGTKTFAGSGSVTMQVALGDIDGDIDLDVVAGNNGTNSEVHFNTNAPVVNSTSPTASFASAPSTGNVTATFSISVTAGDAASFVVHAGMTGKKAGAYSGNNSTTLTFNPSADFFPGETVFSTLTTTVQSASGAKLAKGHVWGFTVDAAVGPAVFNNSASDVDTPTNSSRAVPLGDVDGDGDLDMVVGNEGQANRIHLSNGDGTFASGSDVDTPTNDTRDATLGDVDGDGDLDIVAGNYAQVNRVYLGNGNGTFASGSDIDTPTNNTQSVKLGDVDGDGDLDLIAANANQVNRVYLGNGNGTFASGSDVDTPTNATLSVSLGDVDGDGDLDLVTGNNNQVNRVYLSNGDGTFASGSDVDAPTNGTNSVALEDLDGDGDLDLVAGNNSQANRVYLGNGNGTFASGSDVDTPTNNTRSVVLGDVDGDGDLDLVAGNYTQVNRVYLGNGNGTFASGSDVDTPTNNTQSISLGDLDGDGDLDIATANYTQVNRVYLNSTASPAPTVSSTSPTAAFASASSTGNVTATFSVAVTAGDAASFVVHSSMRGKKAGAYSGNNSTTLTFNPSADFFPGETVFSTLVSTIQDGSGNSLNKGYVWGFTVDAAVGPGSFTAVFSNFGSASGADSKALAVGDIDGDGDVDAVIAHRSGQQNAAYLNNGTGSLTAGVQIYGTGADNSEAIALGDIDGDGDLDVALGNTSQQNVAYLNNGSGSFSAGSANFGSGGDATKAVALGDIDGDGDLDLAAGNENAQNAVYRNNGSGNFSGGTTNFGTGGDATFSLAFGDVDNDGDLDITTGNHNGEQNVAYINDGSGGFGTSQNFGTGSDNTVSVALGDIDGDGDLDVAVGNNSNSQNTAYLNNGSGVFSGGQNFGTGSDWTEGVVLSDVDGDSDLDVVVANYGQQDAAYLNNGSGSFSAGTRNLGAASANSSFAVAGDVDGDGDIDIFTTVNNANDVLYRNAVLPTVSSTSPTAAFANAPSTGNVTATFSVAVTAGDAASFVVHSSMRGKKAGVYSGNNSTTLTFNPSADFFPGETVFSTLVSTINDGSGNSLNKGYVWGFTVDAAVGPAVFSNIANDIDTPTNSTQALSVGDISGDGQLDVLIGNDGQVNRIYLGNGNGTFASGSDVDTPTNATRSVPLGDVDGDGDLDLLTGNDGQVNRVYLGNGNGTFASGNDIDTPTNATTSMAVGDLDGDGDLDAVTGNQNQVNRLYLGNGDGTFAAGSNLSVDTRQTSAIALGDLDGDGDIDLIEGNQDQINRVYLSNGDGTFATGNDVDTPANTSFGVSLGDLDGDGDLDLVVANANQANRVYLSDGDGTFATGNDVDTPTNATRSASLGDVDGDGDLDMVAANQASQANRMYLGNGNGTFASGSDLASVANTTHAAALGDIDGDGDLDFVTGNFNQVNRVYLNANLPVVSSTSPTASFASAPSTGNVTATFSQAVTAADAATFVVFGAMSGTRAGAYSGNNTTTLTFNPTNDFFPGEAVFSTLTTTIQNASGNRIAKSYVWHFTVEAAVGPGSFTSVFSNFGTGSDATAGVDLGDVDGDGDLDIAMANQGEQSLIQLNNGSGIFSAGLRYFGGASDPKRKIKFVDLDIDGDLDVAAAHRPGQNVVHLNDGSGNFATSSNFGTGSDDTYSLAFADFSGDGYIDVAVGNQAEQNVVYLNNGSGALTGSTANFGPGSDATYAVRVADVDNDGDIDVTVGNNGAQNVVYLNDGAVGFGSTVNFGTGSDATHWVDFADVDGDGDADLAVGNYGAQDAVYLNDGAGAFTAGTKNFGSGSDNTEYVVFVDVEGDGDLDVAAGHWGAVDVVYNNDGSGNFTTGSNIGSGSGNTWAIAPGDTDLDGDMDLAVGITGQNAVYLNSALPIVSSTSPTAAFANAPSTGNVTATFSAAVTGGDAASFVVHSSMRGKKAGAYSGGNTTTLTFNPTNDFFPGETVFSTLVSTINDGSGNSLSKGYVWGFTIDAAVGPAVFSSGVTSHFGTGTDNTETVALGDVDGDGDVDAAVVNEIQQNAVYLNDSAGNFTAGTKNFGTGSDASRGVEFADVDGDGDLDIGVANVNQQNAVYLNDGAGNFTAGTKNFGTGSDNSPDLGFGDVDGDGDIDVVTPSNGGQNAGYLNDGSGNFAGAKNFGTGSDAALRAQLRDMDGDGDLDVVWIEIAQNKLELNDGSGNFTAGTNNIPTGGTGSRGLDIGDVDGDGDLDVAIGDIGGQNKVELNDGAGNITAGTKNFGTGTDDTRFVLLGDVDGDGDLDLAVPNDNAAQNTVELNDGSGNFSAGTRNFGTGSDDSRGMALGDVDGDGDLDIVSGNNGEQNVVYFNSNGSSAPTVSSTSPAAAFSNASSTGNVTATFSTAVTGGDAASFRVFGSMSGKRAGAYSGNNSTTLTFNPTNDFFPGETVFSTLVSTINDGSGNSLSKGYAWGFLAAANSGPSNFTAVFSSVSSAGMPAWSAVLADVDGDGDLDAGLSSLGGQNAVELNNGSGSFNAGNRTFGTGTDNTQMMALADLDGDGDLDAVAGNKSSEQNAAYLNDGSGNFNAGTKNFGTGSDETWGVAFGDVDGDGDLDAAVGNYGAQNALYFNDGGGNFNIGSTSFGTGSEQTEKVLLGDFDNDGDLDVAVGNYAQQNVAYLNDGAGSFTAGTKNFGGASDNTQGLALGDIDGDGDLDVASGNYLQQNAAYLNDGAGNFTAGTKNFGTGSDATSFALELADADGDGDLDAVVGNGGAQNVIYLNDASGNFSAGTRNFGTGSESTVSVAVGDVDGDGDLDLLEGVSVGASSVHFNAEAPFEEVASTVGLGSTAKEMGVAVGDLDGDGDLDMFVPASTSADQLYQNNGSGSFSEVASAKSMDDAGDGRGAASADYDNDGDLDVYVTRVGAANFLYQNNGSGTFTDVASTAGVADGTTSGQGASWADYDNDGDLDLYLNNTSITANRLFQNNGSGSFTDVAGTAGVANASSDQMGSWADYDNDGDLDLYVTDNAGGGANFLYQNDGNGSSFTDVSSGALVNHTGASGGIVWTDYDNDGDFDLFTAVSGASDRLYRNDGGSFTDVSATAGVDDTGGGNSVSAGDIDNDGDEDLVVSRVSAATNLFYLNNGDGTYTENAAGLGITGSGNGRGTAFADFDSDGDLDLYVSMYSGANQYYRNKGNGNKWLHVKLTGNGSETNKSAIGVKVEAEVSSNSQWRIVDGGSGQYSQGSQQVEFGIGSAANVDKLTVTWSDGSTTVQNNVASNQTVDITEGGGGGGGLSGGNGPGGVGKTDGSTALAIWLKADANTSTTTDAAAVSSWSDASSSNNGFTQGTGSAQPLYQTNVLNGQPVLRFDGSDDLMTTSGTLALFGSSTSPLTAITVFDTDNNEGQKFLLNHATGSNSTGNFELGYDTGAGTGSGNFGLHEGSANATIVPSGTIASNTFNIMSLGVGSGSSPGNISIHQNGSTLSSSDDNSGWLNSGSYPTGTDNASLGARISADNGTTDSFHAGDIAEIIVVKDKLEDVQRILVENYLSAKYAIALGANDVYVGDDNGNGDYDLDVFGMGKTGGIVHMQGEAGGLKLFDTGFLSDDGDWILAGHASSASVAWVNTDVASAASTERWNRIWYIDETDASSNNGTLRISFDYDAVGLGTPSGSSGDYDLLNRAGQTGDFLVLSGTSKSFNGNVVEFTLDATNLADGYYTLGHTGASLTETQALTGLSGTHVVAPSANQKIFHVGLTGDGTTSVDSLTLTLSDLSTPTGITASDISALCIYSSTDSLFDQGDTQLAVQNAVNIGSATTINLSSNVIPASTERYFIAVVKIAANPTDGHAFRASVAAGALHTSAGSAGSAIAASDANNVTIAVTATKLAFSTQPSGSVSGSALTTQPVVQAQDANGNLDTGINSTITLTTTAGGTLSNATSTMTAGVATFSGLVYTATADGQSIALTADDPTGSNPDLTAATATAFQSDVVATQLVFTTQPAGAVHATALTTQPIVQAQNASGLLDTSATGTITLTPSAGSASGNTATMTAGVATFSDLALSSISSGVTLAAASSASGIASATSNSMAVAIAPVAFTVASTELTKVYDGQPKPVSAATSPSGVSYSVAYNGSTTAPSDPGTYGVVFASTDANYTGSHSVSLTISGPDAPVAKLAATPTTGPVPLTVQFTSTSTGTFSGSTLATGQDGGQLGGFSSGAVTYTKPGTYTAVLTVSGPGGSSQASVTVTVLGPPKLGVIGGVTAKEDDVLTLNLSGKDSGTGAWSVSGLDNALIASAAVSAEAIAFTPVKDRFGSDVVTITRTSALGLKTSQDVMLTWTPVDDPPVFVNLPTTASAKEDSAIRVGGPAFIKDIDSDVKTFVWSASGHQAAIVASANGGTNGVHFAPVQNVFGQSKTTLKVKDPVANFEISQDVVLTWMPVNDPPEKPRIAKPANNARDVPLATVLSWTAADIDKDPLKFDVFFARVGQAPKQVAKDQMGTGYSALGLEPGSEYEWRVVARDPSGATADTVARFTTEADKLPPRIAMLSATPVADGVRIVWGTDEPAAFALDYRSAPEIATDTVDIGNLVDTLRTRKFEVALLALQPATWYDFSVRVRDRFQNESQPATGRFRTLAAPDTVKPIITPGSVAVNGITEQGVWIRWLTDELSTGVVTYEELGAAAKLAQATDGASSGVVREQALSRDHAIELVGLKANTRYRFVAESVDASGNSSPAVEDVFETAAEADIVAPKFTLGPGARAPKVESVDIELEADEVVQVEVRYDIDDTPEDGRVASGGDPATGHQVRLDGLLAGTTYSFQVEIVDVGGNNTLSDILSFETRAAPDTTAPKAEGWRVVPSAERALLDFAFDEAVTARVSWWPLADVRKVFFSDIVEADQRHKLALGNLEAATDYAYEVVAADEEGNASAPIADGFTTKAAPDTLPPVILNALVNAKRLESTVLLVDLNEVATIKGGMTLKGLPDKVEAGGAKVGDRRSVRQPSLLEKHRIPLTKLVPGAVYSVDFEVADPYGNRSAGLIEFKAPLRPDVEPPQLTQLPSVLSVNEAGARIGVAYNEDVQLKVRYAPAADASIAETRNFTQPQQKHAFELNGLKSGVEYTVALEALDAANLSNKQSLNFTTLAARDTIAPVFTKLPWVEDAQLTSVRLRLETDEPVVAALQLTDVADANRVFSTSVVERAKSHALEVTGLDTGAVYNYLLRVADANRNDTTATGQVRTIDKVVPPRIVEGPTRQRIGFDRAWLKLATNVPTRVVVDYFLASSPSDVQIDKPSGRGKAHVVQLTNLLPDTTYAYSVVAVDDKAKLTSPAVAGSFRTAKGPDIVAPKIQGAPSVASIADTRAKIIWKTDEPSDSFVDVTGPQGKRTFSNPDPTLAHEVELTNLQADAPHSYIVRSRDLAGNKTSSSSFSFTTLAAPDTLPPQFARKPIVRSLAHDNAVIAYSASEPSSSTVDIGTSAAYELGTRAIADQVLNHEVRIDGLAAGTEYHLRVGLTDAQGNGPAYFPDLVVKTDAAPDTLAPEILTGPFAPPPTESQAIVEWTTDEPATRAVRYWKKDAPNDVFFSEEGALALTHRLVLSNLESGAIYEYVAASSDEARNGPTESEVGEFRTQSRPQKPIFTGGPVAEADEASATVTWTTNVPSNSIVDLGEDTQYGVHVEQADLVQDHEVVLKNLKAGVLYHYKVTSIDLAGNVLSTDPSGLELHSGDLTVRTLGQADTEAPRLVAEPTTVWTDKSVVVSWETDEASTSRIEWEVIGQSSGNDPTAGFVEDNQLLFAHSLTLTGLKPRTLYAVKVVSEDAAGNQMVWQPTAAAKAAAKMAFGRGLRTFASGKVAQPPGGAGTFVTDSFPDTRLPVITGGPRVREKSAESVTIEWQTDELSDSFVRFGEQEVNLQEVVGEPQDVQVHSVTLTNLAPGTSYYFQVESTDPSGNGASKSGIAVATTATGADLSPPRYVREPRVVATTDVQATLAWTSDEAASAKVEYWADGVDVAVRQVRERLSQQQVSLTNLLPNTEYRALITLRDANRNTTPTPFELRFVTDAEPDLTPPRFLSEPRIKVLGDQSATIVWETDELASSFVDFDQSPYLGQVVGDPTYTTQHEIRLTNLEADSTYFFRAGSVDRAQNGPIESPVSSFRTLAEPDTKPPAVPSAVRATAGPGAVYLQWDAVAASDLGGYTVYREDLRRRFVAVATGLTEPNYLDVGLTNRRTYRYRISASDAQTPANESASSTVVTARPSEDAIGQAPQIIGLEQGAEAGKPVVMIGNAVPLDIAAELSYTVQVSTQEDFSTMVDRGGNIGESLSGTTRWRLTRSLDPQASYWFRARVFDGLFEGPWSAAQQLRSADAVTATNSEDFDGDGTVGFRDFFIMANGFGSTDAVLDLDQGGSVGGEDFDRFKKSFGEVMPAKRLETQRVAVAQGSRVEVEAEAISSNRVIVRLKLDGVKDLSGYGFSIAADPPILRYIGRADSAVFGGRGASLELAHDGSVLAVGEHLRGRQASLDMSEGWEIALLFAMDGAPRNVDLRVEEGFLGTGRGRMLRVEQEGRARIVPQVYALYANYPNPFNPSTTIPLAIPQWSAGLRRQKASLTLYNALGQVVRSWNLDGWSPGFHALQWDGRNARGHAVASGVYLVRLRAGDFVQVRKALLLR